MTAFESQKKERKKERKEERKKEGRKEKQEEKRVKTGRTNKRLIEERWRKRKKEAWRQKIKKRVWSLTDRKAEDRRRQGGKKEAKKPRSKKGKEAAKKGRRTVEKRRQEENGSKLWSKIIKNHDISTGPLACPFACSLVGSFCTVHFNRALRWAHLFAHSLTHLRACGKVNDQMTIFAMFFSVLDRSVLVKVTGFIPLGNLFVKKKTSTPKPISSVLEVGYFLATLPLFWPHVTSCSNHFQFLRSFYFH